MKSAHFLVSISRFKKDEDPSVQRFAKLDMGGVLWNAQLFLVASEIAFNGL